MAGGALRQASTATPPSWETMLVGGGGWMRGIDSTGGVILARSDTPPSLYRFDNAADKWKPLLTSFSLPSSYHQSYGSNAVLGVWAARICPSLLTKFYMIYHDLPWVSTNSGASWSIVNGTGWPSDTMDANASDAQQNQRLAVSPADHNKVWVGTPTKGTYKSTDGGATWAKDTNLATPTSTGTAFGYDPTSGGTTLFAAVSGTGVYRSVNDGTSWTLLNTAGMPTTWIDLFVDHTGKPWVSNGTNLKSWTSGGGWVTSGMTDNPACAVVDPSNANNVLACSQGGRFYKSTDAGATFPQTGIISMTIDATGDALWMNWGPTAGYQGGGSGYSAGSYGLSASNLVPDNAGNCYFAYGFGVLKQSFANIFNGQTSTITFRAFQRGLESIDATSILHPPGGNPIGTAWDLMTWNFTNSRTYATAYGPDDNYYGPMPNYGVNLIRGLQAEYASSNPAFMTCLTTVGGYYSSNRGVNWTKFTNSGGTDPFGFVYQGGCIASSTTTNHVVMIKNAGISYTTDNGVTWTPATYAGAGYADFPFFYSNFIAADRVTANKFYALSPGEGWYVSTNSGATWSFVRADTVATGLCRVKAVPGNAGHVFFVVGNFLVPQPESSAVLKWTTDSFSSTYSTLSGFQSVEDVGFGAVVGSYPTLYIAAYRTSTGVYGVYKCENFNASTGAGTWVLMTNSDGSNYPEGWIAAISGVAGDPATPNRVSVAYSNGGFKRYA